MIQFIQALGRCWVYTRNYLGSNSQALLEPVLVLVHPTRNHKSQEAQGTSYNLTRTKELAYHTHSSSCSCSLQHHQVHMIHSRQCTSCILSLSESPMPQHQNSPISAQTSEKWNQHANRKWRTTTPVACFLYHYPHFQRVTCDIILMLNTSCFGAWA